MLEYLALLLPVAAGSGWYLGRMTRPNKMTEGSTKIPREYFMGLNFLINEQPDKALDIFIKMLEVDSSTVEMHWALGSLFRRRGETDRAIRIHQNLIARPGLTKKERNISLLELGQDYMRAGVFDRAEGLFKEAITMSEREGTIPGLKFLLAIYEQEKDWKDAIEIARKLEAATGKPKQKRIAHYYCELAELARTKEDVDNAKRYLKKALASNPECVRAALLRATLEVDAGQYKTAMRYYKRIKEQDPDYISEAITPLATCCEELNQEQDLIDYLRECLHDYPRVSIALALTEKIRKYHGDEAATWFITDQIHQHPSLRGLNKVIELHTQRAKGDFKGQLSVLKDITDKLLTNKNIYQCKRCGFAGKVMHWLCPGCRSWGSVKPIHGLEGD